MSATTRFYTAENPQINEVVMITVHIIKPNDIEVLLPEYNNITATVPVAERKQKPLQVGEQFTATVTHINRSEPSIKVSMDRPSASESTECKDRFVRAKILHKILSRTAIHMHINELYEQTVWYFEAKLKRKTAAYDIFEEAANEPVVLDECHLDMLTKRFLLYFIKEEFTKQSRCLCVDVKCFIRSVEEECSLEAVLQLLIDKSFSSTNARIKALGSAKYRIAIKTEKADEGRKQLLRMVERVRTKILNMNGQFEFIGTPENIRAPF